MKKLLLILMVLMIAVGALFASGAKEASSSSTSTGEVKYKEHLILGTYNACPSLDYYRVATGSSNMIFLAAKERLVYYNPDAQEFEPSLATSWKWDGNTVTFKLREDVYWTNGEKFTADDVVYTYEHCKELNSTFQEKLDTVVAIDDYTVAMTLKVFDADWLHTLVAATSSISNRKAMEESNDTTVTTGPWIITDFAADDYVVMERNEKYWGELPKTKKLTFRYIPEASARLVALQSGDIDICFDPASVDLDLVEDDPNLRLEIGDSSKTIYLCFNTKKAPFDNVDFRKAVAYAIDKQEIVDIAKDGKAIVGASTWGPATFGFDSSITGYEQNLDLAKEYLQKVFPDGKCTVEISVRTGDWEPIVDVLQEQLRKIGIEVKINTMQNAAFTEYCLNEEHEMAVSGCAWPVAAGAWANRIYTGTSGANRAKLNDPVVNDLIARADSGRDDAERIQLYQQVQHLNEENVWYITVYYDGTKTALKKDIQGGRFDLPEKEVAYIYLPL